MGKCAVDQHLMRYCFKCSGFAWAQAIAGVSQANGVNVAITNDQTVTFTQSTLSGGPLPIPNNQAASGATSGSYSA